MLNHATPTVTQQPSSTVKKVHPLTGSARLVASPKSPMPPGDPPGTIVALPLMVSVGFVFLVEGSPKASVHRRMLSAAVAVDRVIRVAGFTRPAPRSCLASLWRYSACTKNNGKACADKAPLGEPPGRGTSEDGRRRARPSSPKEQRRRISGFRISRCSQLSHSSSSSHPKSEQGCARPRHRRITRLFSGTDT